MPVSVSYPGVYIEEIPSGVRTIIGVPTSITAFLGRAPKGSPDEPVTCLGFGDFERAFGGLHPEYPMSYAVAQFFQNGGGRAVVVRLYKAPAGATTAAEIDVADELGTGKAFILAAASPGTWASGIRVRVEKHETDQAVKDLAARWKVPEAGIFDLIVHDTTRKLTERHVSLTVKESPRRVDRVLVAESTLVRVTGAHDPDKPPKKSDDIPDDKRKEIWTNDKYSIKVARAGVDSDKLDLAAYKGSPAGKRGIYALEKTDIFNILCIPPDEAVEDKDTEDEVYQEALGYCVKRRAMLLVDPKAAWNTPAKVVEGSAAGFMGLSSDDARNAALFFPRLRAPNAQRGGAVESFVPCGAVAGVMARTDVRRGVWKAAAGIDAGINGISGLTVSLTDDENGLLNPLGVNCLRVFPLIGTVVWGARTLRGADLLADEYKYVPIRRLALFIEETLFRGTKWVVFEPNDEPLWAQIRLNVGVFMNTLFRQGAFQGRTPQEAYFVRCDKDTNPQADIDRGIVNIHVGFAPLKPAEFVIIRLQQIAGRLAV
jgi:phage tail sheath protein FI